MYVATTHLPYSEASLAQVVVEAMASRRNGVAAVEDAVDCIGVSRT